MISTPEKNKHGDTIWRNKAGLIHRDDGPAYEYVNGGKAWYKYGRLHRENGPAVEWADDEKHWFINGQRHRENGPAVEYLDGGVKYYLNDQTGPEVEQKVKENMAYIQQKKLLNGLSQDNEISAKIKTSSSAKISKKL